MNKILRTIKLFFFWYRPVMGRCPFCNKNLSVVYDLPIYKIDKTSSHSFIFCYNLKEVDKFSTNLANKDLKRSYFSKQAYYKNYGINRKWFKRYFDKFDHNDYELISLFEKYKTPIFTISRHDSDMSKLIINPNLKYYSFERIFDPYSAYQEISMFLGNMALPEKEIPHIPDKIMVEAKGFDKRYSFRKEKSKKK